VTGFGDASGAGTRAVSSAARTVRVSAPGKLILMGEHSVVYGHPAIAVAVQRRLRVTARVMDDDVDVPETGASPHAVRLTLAGGSPITVPWQEALRLADDTVDGDPGKHYGAAYLALVALGEARRLVPHAIPSMTVEVRSRIPEGHGMGSSAALALGITAAVVAAVAGHADGSALEAAAHRVERRQHGSPSGIDGATVRRGGVVHGVCVAGVGPREMSFHALRASPRALSRFRAFDSGRPVHGTGQVVAAVRRRLERDGSLERELDRMGELVRDFGDALVTGHDPTPVRDAIRAFEAGLEALGVVPPSVARLIRRVEVEGGAAKISGAGGLCDGRDGRPGAGMVLVYHEEPERIRHWRFLGGLRPVDAPLGGPGLEAP
jgi:mevalonate kinase